MKKVWMAVSIGSLFAIGGLAETLTGTISDSQCGAKHEAASASDTSCVERCVKRGNAPVFVAGGKVYQISADSREKVMPLLGKKVSVNGKVEGDTIAIDSAEASK